MMRLINVHTLKLEEFVGSTPPYAILSHTWGPKEVSLQEFQLWSEVHPEFYFEYLDLGYTRADWEEIHPILRRRLENREVNENHGVVKILRCAAQAMEAGLRHIWVDTCCIDKTSSAELQEAINSMFRWYEEAVISYAYLSDIKKKDVGRLASCRWFTRGWTLQELLAPKSIIFFDGDWEPLGRKDELLRSLEVITGIGSVYLRSGAAKLREASIATRMSWAAGRETTRIEDMAYCLLGIFEINMPMLYGEGGRAFRRLQEEIMKVSDDPSLMAWNYSGSWKPLPPVDADHDGLLATSPKQFGKCRHIISNTLRRARGISSSFSMSQHGLEFQGQIVRDVQHRMLFYAVLGCGFPQTTGSPEIEHHMVLPLLSSRPVDGASAIDIVCSRETWLVPMTVTRRFVATGELGKLRIVRPLDHTIGRRHLLFNSYIFEPEWEFVGIYPPRPEALQLCEMRYPAQNTVFLTSCPWDIEQLSRDNEVKWVLCYKQRHNGSRAVVFINYVGAEVSRCAKTSQDPRKGWCWIAELGEPFDLQCAQRLLLDTEYQKRLSLAGMRDKYGREIPHQDVLTYVQPAPAILSKAKSPESKMENGDQTLIIVDELL